MGDEEKGRAAIHLGAIESNRDVIEDIHCTGQFFKPFMAVGVEIQFVRLIKEWLRLQQQQAEWDNPHVIAGIAEEEPEWKSGFRYRRYASKRKLAYQSRSWLRTAW